MAKLFDDSENRFGAFAGAAALVLVLALTAMALSALEPERRTSNHWNIALSERVVPAPSLAN